MTAAPPTGLPSASLTKPEIPEEVNPWPETSAPANKPSEATRPSMRASSFAFIGLVRMQLSKDASGRSPPGRMNWATARTTPPVHAAGPRREPPFECANSSSVCFVRRYCLAGLPEAAFTRAAPTNAANGDRASASNLSQGISPHSRVEYGRFYIVVTQAPAGLLTPPAAQGPPIPPRRAFPSQPAERAAQTPPSRRPTPGQGCRS